MKPTCHRYFWPAIGLTSSKSRSVFLISTSRHWSAARPPAVPNSSSIAALPRTFISRSSLWCIRTTVSQSVAEGKVVDWLVVMNRLDEAQMLDRVIAERRLQRWQLDRLAARSFSFIAMPAPNYCRQAATCRGVPAEHRVQSPHSARPALSSSLGMVRHVDARAAAVSHQADRRSGRTCAGTAHRRRAW